MLIVRRCSRWFRAGAATAIFALLVQAAVPSIVAAEIDFAGGADGIFDQCLFAHLEPDADDDNDGPGDSHHHHDHGDCGLCPICLALLASPAYSAPPEIIVPIPISQFVYRFATFEQSAPTIAATVAYRSRAPPIV